MDTLPGLSFPLGATVHPDGVNFCVFSKNCDALELLLFDDADAPQAARVIPLDPKRNKTFYYWHVFVPSIGAGQCYGYRAHGPFAPDEGHRFDGSKVLLDPYARAVAVGARYSREAAVRPGDNCAYAPRSVVVDSGAYDWEGDVPLQLPYASTIIYEMHVGGFTRHPNSGIADDKRGTYAGLIAKIPYLQALGITAVELLPVQQFDEQDASPPLENYWGYSPMALFAPHTGYSSRRDALGAVDEFRDMVKALHRAGIEVILDVVFNHTAEGNHQGPTLSFRGLENRAYYILEENRAYYSNYSGCGNTLNGNHSIVRRMIIDCLRYWAADMHVDGFRFDLASVMSRDEWGQPLRSPPILWEIESDPVLSGTKIIAEAWDALGLYQVGSFIGHRWAEWNGQFRDDVRRFVKSDPGMVTKLAMRITGSPDLYPQPDREPNRSINFVTCHDGFTLNDLVSYNDKHNDANGEQNRDGTDTNLSWNCGVEGETDNPAVEALRLRQIKNFLTILFVSQGTPMLLMGDEVRRTQRGNNNAYCQDNELTWFDWSGVEHHAGLLRFVKGLIRFTQTDELFREERFWIPLDDQQQYQPYLTWHGVRLGKPDWGYNSRTLAFSLYHPDSGSHLHVMLNSYWKPLTFQLPPLPTKPVVERKPRTSPPPTPSPACWGERDERSEAGVGTLKTNEQRLSMCWLRIVDTALSSPDDFCDREVARPVDAPRYRVEARSVVLLARANRRP